MSEVLEIRDGDIFRWAYAEPPNDRFSYHCKSQIAIAKNGYLVDTYWGATGTSVAFPYSEAWDYLNLEYLGNLDGLDAADPWKAQYYDAADIVDIRHPNASSGNFYIRKGAVRCAAKMLETAEYERDKAISAVQSAARRLENMDAAISRITGGSPLDEIYL
jgi:hypothetical protein